QLGNADNVIYQIDPKRDVLVNTFDIGFRCTPNGLGINPSNNLAILTCRRSPNTVIWDLAAGQIVSVVGAVGDGDMGLYDPVADLFFTATRQHPEGPAIGIFRGATGEYITKIPTIDVQSGNVAYDQTNNIVYTSDLLNGSPNLVSFQLPTFYQ